MAVRRTLADLRDERAGDRDDAADHRDGIAHDRDDAADRRDADAADRDEEARHGSTGLADRFREIWEQILDRFTRTENATIDPDDWPDLTPAIRLAARGPSPRTRRATASNEAVNCPARSRTRNRNRPTRSPRSITRLRALTDLPRGCAVDRARGPRPGGSSTRGTPLTKAEAKPRWGAEICAKGSQSS